MDKASNDKSHTVTLEDNLDETIEKLNLMTTEEFRVWRATQQQIWEGLIYTRASLTPIDLANAPLSLFDIMRITYRITNPSIIRYALTKFSHSQGTLLNNTLYQRIQAFFDHELLQQHPNQPTHLLLLAIAIFFNLSEPVETILQLGRLLDRGGLYLLDIQRYYFEDISYTSDPHIPTQASREAACELLTPIVSEYQLHNNPNKILRELTKKFEKKLLALLTGQAKPLQKRTLDIFSYELILPNQLFMWALHTWLEKLHYEIGFKNTYDTYLSRIIETLHPHTGKLLLSKFKALEHQSKTGKTVHLLQGKFLLCHLPPSLLIESLYSFEYSRFELPLTYRALFRKIHDYLDQQSNDNDYHQQRSNWSTLAEKNLLIEETLSQSGWPEVCLNFALLICLSPENCLNDIKKYKKVSRYSANQYINSHLSDDQAITCIIQWIGLFDSSNERALVEWISDRYVKLKPRGAFIEKIQRTIEERYPHLTKQSNDFFRMNDTDLYVPEKPSSSTLFSTSQKPQEKWTEMVPMSHTSTII